MKLYVSFADEMEAVNASFFDGSEVITADFGVIEIITDPSGIKRYDGPYSIVPKVSDQQFETTAKLMNENLSVLAIPVLSVSNPSGGVTVTIGGE